MRILVATALPCAVIVSLSVDGGGAGDAHVLGPRRCRGGWGVRSRPRQPMTMIAERHQRRRGSGCVLGVFTLSRRASLGGPRSCCDRLSEQFGQRGRLIAESVDTWCCVRRRAAIARRCRRVGGVAGERGRGSSRRGRRRGGRSSRVRRHDSGHRRTVAELRRTRRSSRSPARTMWPWSMMTTSSQRCSTRSS